MLSYLRKRKGSTLIKGILIAVALTFFGGFGLLGYCRSRESSRDKEANTAASVNDTVITRQQLLKAIQRANTARTSPQTEAEALKQKDDILNTLINQELIYQEAVNSGITVSDNEVQQTIAQIFQKDGVFNPQFYRAYLVQNNMSESDLEDNIRRQLIITKMSETVTAGALVSEDDVYQSYIFQYQQAKLDLLKVDQEKITDVPKPTESELTAKYKASPEGITIPEKRKVKYACFNGVKMVSPSSITKIELTDYYEKAKDFRFSIKPKKVKARKIFFSVPMIGGSEEAAANVKDRAEKVLAEAKAGGTPFEDLARKYSEDPETGASGGDMGWMELREVGIPGAYVLQKLKPGEISDVVRGMDGFYIFKLEEEEPGQYKPLSQVRKEVIEGVRKINGAQKAKQAAQSILNKVREGTTFEEAVKLATAEVKLSDYLLQGAEKLDNIPDSGALVAAAYKLWEINQVSDVLQITDEACVLQLAEISEEHTATYEEAVPKLNEEILAERRKEAAKKIADEILAAIQAGTPFEKAAAKYTVAQIIHTDFFARQKNTVPEVGYAPDMVSAAFALPPHDPIAKKVFEVGGKFYLVKLVSLKEAEQDGYNKVASQLRIKLLRDKQKEILDSWIESLKQKAKIVKQKEPEESEAGGSI